MSPTRFWTLFCAVPIRLPAGGNGRGLSVTAGLDPAIHATWRVLRIDSDLWNIINYLIAILSVLVDGRVKPGHDGKPRVGRYNGATSHS
jgi:hypothetical protein